MQRGAHRHNGNRPYGAGSNEGHAIAYGTQWNRLTSIHMYSIVMISRPVGSCLCYSWVCPLYVQFFLDIS